MSALACVEACEAPDALGDSDAAMLRAANQLHRMLASGADGLDCDVPPELEERACRALAGALGRIIQRDHASMHTDQAARLLHDLLDLLGGDRQLHLGLLHPPCDVVRVLVLLVQRRVAQGGAAAGDAGDANASASATDGADNVPRSLAATPIVAHEVKATDTQVRAMQFGTAALTQRLPRETQVPKYLALHSCGTSAACRPALQSGGARGTGVGPCSGRR